MGVAVLSILKERTHHRGLHRWLATPLPPRHPARGCCCTIYKRVKKEDGSQQIITSENTDSTRRDQSRTSRSPKAQN
ncbi:unnamed protein product [Boreogadus saida]